MVLMSDGRQETPANKGMRGRRCAPPLERHVRQIGGHTHDRRRTVEHQRIVPPIVPSTLCSEKDYVLNEKLRKEANAALGIRTNWRPTRWKIDFLTPVLFSAVWVALVAYELVHCLTRR